MMFVYCTLISIENTTEQQVINKNGELWHLAYYNISAGTAFKNKRFYFKFVALLKIAFFSFYFLNFTNYCEKKKTNKRNSLCQSAFVNASQIFFLKTKRSKHKTK